MSTLLDAFLRAGRKQDEELLPNDATQPVMPEPLPNDATKPLEPEPLVADEQPAPEVEAIAPTAPPPPLPEDTDFSDLRKSAKTTSLIANLGRVGDTIGSAISGIKPNSSFYDNLEKQGRQDYLDAKTEANDGFNNQYKKWMIQRDYEKAKQAGAPKKATSAEDPNHPENVGLREAYKGLFTPEEQAAIDNDSLNKMTKSAIEARIAARLKEKEQTLGAEKAKEEKRRWELEFGLKEREAKAKEADAASKKDKDSKEADAELKQGTVGFMGGVFKPKAGFGVGEKEGVKQLRVKSTMAGAIVPTLDKIQSDLEAIIKDPSKALSSPERSRLEANQTLIAPAMSVAQGQGAMSNDEFARAQNALGPLGTRDGLMDMLTAVGKGDKNAAALMRARLQASKDYFTFLPKAAAETIHYEYEGSGGSASGSPRPGPKPVGKEKQADGSYMVVFDDGSKKPLPRGQ